jgi:hypothetical protein
MHLEDGIIWFCVLVYIYQEEYITLNMSNNYIYLYFILYSITLKLLTFSHFHLNFLGFLLRGQQILTHLKSIQSIQKDSQLLSMQTSKENYLTY